MISNEYKDWLHSEEMKESLIEYYVNEYLYCDIRHSSLNATYYGKFKLLDKIVPVGCIMDLVEDYCNDYELDLDGYAIEEYEEYTVKFMKEFLKANMGELIHIVKKAMINSKIKDLMEDFK